MEKLSVAVGVNLEKSYRMATGEDHDFKKAEHNDG